MMLGVNPDGAWSYAYLSNSTFNLLGSSWTGSWSTGPYVFFGQGGTPGVGVNLGSAEHFGVAPGHASLECDWLTPDARWTAPQDGLYDIGVTIGSPVTTGPDGFGNAHAAGANLSIDGVGQPYNSYANNTMTWDLLVFLHQNDAVDAWVQNAYGGGNTDTTFIIDAVPEPVTLVAFAVGLLALARRRR